MEWIRASKYHLASVPPGFTIARTNNENDRVYQLYKGKELMSSRIGITNDEEAAMAIREFKDKAEEINGQKI